jgi:hypothetical protein
MKRSIRLDLATALLALASGTAEATVSLPAVLGEHMVVQRELPFRVWGQAAPAEAVTASFRGESRGTVADELGRWSVFLPPSAAGGPFTLSVSASNTIRLEDVWVGDVWVAAGQSNMEWTLDAADGAATEIPQARHSRSASCGRRGRRRASARGRGHRGMEGLHARDRAGVPGRRLLLRAPRARAPRRADRRSTLLGRHAARGLHALPTIAGDRRCFRAPALAHGRRAGHDVLEIEKEKRELEAAAAHA